MKGSHRIIVESRKVKYDFVFIGILQSLLVTVDQVRLF